MKRETFGQSRESVFKEAARWLGKAAQVFVLAGIWGYVHYMGAAGLNVSPVRDRGWWAACCAAPVMIADGVLLYQAYRRWLKRSDPADEWPQVEKFPDYQPQRRALEAQALVEIGDKKIEPNRQKRQHVSY